MQVQVLFPAPHKTSRFSGLFLFVIQLVYDIKIKGVAIAMDEFQSYAHLIFDANCYFDLIIWLVKLHLNQPKLSSVLSPFFSRDLSVFLHETFVLTKQSAPESGEDKTIQEFYKDLEVMRNNVHQLVTRDKKFADESERLLLRQKCCNRFSKQKITD